MPYPALLCDMPWSDMCHVYCAGKPLHGITTEHKKEDFKLYLGIFWFWSSKFQSLKFESVPGRAVPTACASPGAMLDTPPEHAWAVCKDGSAHLSSLWCWWQWNGGISGHDKPQHNLCCFSNTDAWAVESKTIPTSPAHTHSQGKSRAQQVSRAADPGLSNPSLSWKFQWICPWLQINAGWGPLSRPSPSHCSCGFYRLKEEP